MNLFGNMPTSGSENGKYINPCSYQILEGTFFFSQAVNFWSCSVF
jgi:hypothetical protein